MKLSVVMPVYNERATLRAVVERVIAVAPMALELICVDDGATDNSREILRSCSPSTRKSTFF